MGIARPASQLAQPCIYRRSWNQAARFAIAEGVLVTVPPIDIQDEFAEQAASIGSLQTQQVENDLASQVTFDAILTRAFREGMLCDHER